MNIDNERKLQFANKVLNLMKDALSFNIDRNNSLVTYSKPKSEFISKLSYALNTVFKIFLTAKDLGHWFDYKSYKQYREKKGILSSRELDEISNYNKSIANSLNGINKRLLASVNNTLNLINNDENALNLFYEYIVNNEEIKNIYIIFKNAMLNCGAKIEVLKTDWFGKNDLDVKDASPLLNDSLLQIKNLIYREKNYMKNNNLSPGKIRS